MVVGLLRSFKGTPHWFYRSRGASSRRAYVILAFPYMFFSLDAGFRSIDVHTLTEASQSLGARWATTLFRVILPNIRVGGARRVVSDARDRDGRVHDREPRCVPHLPDLHPVRQRVAGLPGWCAHADELRHHLGGDARRCSSSAVAEPRAAPGSQERQMSLPPAREPPSRLRHGQGAERDQHLARRGRVPVAARSVGLRQDDRAAARRRLRPPRTRAASSSTARTYARRRPTSATWGWSSRRTRCSRT